METYAAFIIGIGGGVSYMITTWLVLFKLKVDDPLDACAGTSCVCVGFFSIKNPCGPNFEMELIFYCSTPCKFCYIHILLFSHKRESRIFNFKSN